VLLPYKGLRACAVENRTYGTRILELAACPCKFNFDKKLQFCYNMFKCTENTVIKTFCQKKHGTRGGFSPPEKDGTRRAERRTL